MFNIYLRMQSIEEDKVDCPVTQSFKTIADFKIIVLSANLIFLCWETLWLIKSALKRATNNCKPRSSYSYESSDEEDDRHFFEQVSFQDSIDAAIEGRRRLIQERNSAPLNLLNE